MTAVFRLAWFPLRITALPTAFLCPTPTHFWPLLRVNGPLPFTPPRVPTYNDGLSDTMILRNSHRHFHIPESFRTRINNRPRPTFLLQWDSLMSLSHNLAAQSIHSAPAHCDRMGDFSPVQRLPPLSVADGKCIRYTCLICQTTGVPCARGNLRSAYMLLLMKPSLLQRAGVLCLRARLAASICHLGSSLYLHGVELILGALEDFRMLHGKYDNQCTREQATMRYSEIRLLKWTVRGIKEQHASALISPPRSSRSHLPTLLRHGAWILFPAFDPASGAHARGCCWGNPVVQVRDNLVHLPLAKRFNLTGSGTLLARDQAHVQNLRARAQAKLSGRRLHRQRRHWHSPTTYTLLVDTGSSNTWVGAGRSFVETSSTVQTRDRVSVTYGSGSFSGTEFTDTVTLGGGLTVTGQSIGVASRSTGFSGVDGIIGIGPVDLTVGTLSPDTTSTIPTITDNLFGQGVITSDLVAVSFEPTQSLSSTNGELTFGGTDSTKFTGSISFAPLTKTSPASLFFGINQSIRYGTSTNILSSTAGIVDTGTTLTLIATDAIARYQSATGAVLDNTTGLLRLTTAQFANLQSLFFVINGVTFELTANAQIWPRALNTAIGGNTNSVYLIVGSIGTPSGEGLDFINGMTFLERFYAVFDTANSRVGFAQTPFTTATTQLNLENRDL
ncbi:Polyporopepsin [Grifola frondosa]|uniref:Polyporopepsin n=1 Tax=Grifola frondosa TaxID=5627 RepID=A0A1C7MR57_GRIFR|nr:Polyporopepsin [Grifola frondosa]